MRFRPFSKAIEDVTAEDILGMIPDVPEGLFIEYKREWEPRKVARAIASFANSPGGGTLIVGMEANGLHPTALPGIPQTEDLEERVVQVARSSIAPTPVVRPRTVNLDTGKCVLIVETPEGLQPPYVLLRTGQILVRTPTSSDPVPPEDRATIDRLFMSGERGREWAITRSQSIIDRDSTWSSTIATLPEVDGGISVAQTVFRRSFSETLLSLSKGWWIHPFGEPSLSTTRDSAVVGFSGPSPDDGFRAEVSAGGEILTQWRKEQISAGLENLRIHLRQILPIHSIVYEEHLEYPGQVTLTAFNRWKTPSGGVRQASTTRADISVMDLSSQGLLDELARSLARSSGEQVYEPE